MARTDIKIYSTDSSEKKITTTISHVNDQATSATLLEFAQKMNAFTTNNFNEADRINTINLSTESVMQEVTINLKKTAFQLTNQDNDNYLLTIPASDIEFNFPDVTISMAQLEHVGGAHFGKLLAMKVSEETATKNQLTVLIPKTEFNAQMLLSIATYKRRNSYYAAITAVNITLTTP